MTFDIRKLFPLMIFLLLITSLGCMENPSEKVDNFHIGMRGYFEPENGTVPNTETNIEELESELSQNGSLDVQLVEENVIKIDVLDYTTENKLNFTEEAKMWGNITVEEDEVLVYPKIEFSDEILEEEYSSDREVIEPTKEILMTNWGWIIEHVKQVYGVDLVAWGEDIRVDTEE